MRSCFATLVELKSRAGPAVVLRPGPRATTEDVGGRRHGKLDRDADRAERAIAGYRVSFLRGRRTGVPFVQITASRTWIRLPMTDVRAIAAKLGEMHLWTWSEVDFGLGWCLDLDRVEPSGPFPLEEEGWWTLRPGPQDVLLELRGKRMPDGALLPVRVLLDVHHEGPPRI
jgi:hypothetical protein